MDLDRDTDFVGEALELVFPKAHARTIGTTAVGGDEKAARCEVSDAAGNGHDTSADAKGTILVTRLRASTEQQRIKPPFEYCTRNSRNPPSDNSKPQGSFTWNGG